MRVMDIMTRPVHVLRPNDTIERAAAMLAAKQITAAPVLDAADQLVGVVSEGDLLWHRLPAAPRRPWHAAGDATERPRAVGDVMSRQPVTAAPEDDISDVAEKMLAHDVRSVPVVSDGEVVGIVSRRDILRTVVRTDDVLCQEIQHRLDEYAGGVRRWTASVTEGVATVDGGFDDHTERLVVAILARTVPGVVAVHPSSPEQRTPAAMSA